MAEIYAEYTGKEYAQFTPRRIYRVEAVTERGHVGLSQITGNDGEFSLLGPRYSLIDQGGLGYEFHFNGLPNMTFRVVSEADLPAIDPGVNFTDEFLKLIGASK